jgi:hypothetical protein
MDACALIDPIGRVPPGANRGPVMIRMSPWLGPKRSLVESMDRTVLQQDGNVFPVSHLSSLHQSGRVVQTKSPS